MIYIFNTLLIVSYLKYKPNAVNNVLKTICKITIINTVYYYLTIISK